MEEEKKNIEENQEKLNDSLKELKRRIDLTRRARFSCSTRLRDYFERVQNLIVYYNMLVVIVSIITLFQFYNENATWSTYITLALSIALSFFATHMGGKNYKEKAIMMESNGHELSKIYGKIAMLDLRPKLDSLKVSGLYKEYERTLVIVENHESIDYLEAKKVKSTLSQEETKELEAYNKKVNRQFNWAYAIPTIIGICLLLSPFISNIL